MSATFPSLAFATRYDPATDVDALAMDAVALADRLYAIGQGDHEDSPMQAARLKRLNDLVGEALTKYEGGR